MTDEPKYRGTEIRWTDPVPNNLCFAKMPDGWPGARVTVENGVPTELVNLCPNRDGTLRPEATKNAVVIQYFEGVDYEGNRILFPAVHVECVDREMERELIDKAQEIIRKL